jgi:hypothetical protein
VKIKDKASLENLLQFRSGGNAKLVLVKHIHFNVACQTLNNNTSIAKFKEATLPS